ncbi:MAG: hypothetical protein J5585_03520 [Clostridia bacterium]|nr:hypothetical protein [Clostridia bacterium]
MYKYVINETTVRDGDAERTWYGIDVYRGGEKIRSVYDISPDREATGRLARTCSRLGLDLIHFDDVIDDFIG